MFLLVFVFVWVWFLSWEVGGRLEEEDVYSFSFYVGRDSCVFCIVRRGWVGVLFWEGSVGLEIGRGGSWRSLVGWCRIRWRWLWFCSLRLSGVGGYRRRMSSVGVKIVLIIYLGRGVLVFLRISFFRVVLFLEFCFIRRG